MKITEDDFGFNVSNCCDGTNLQRRSNENGRENNTRIVVLF